ncbi:MAG TPA: Slp family lipoprotein, partial [Verrucomicrobiae bacterium]|nr:Slp family lipoprotein [Verrucomicrobiae bacterium]
MNAVKYLAIALLLALLAGCASYPISDQFRQQARQITLDQVRADPEGTRGKIVIWGGRIINVVNESKGSSIYILCLPYREDEQPIPYAPSPGRFIATSTGFLDPEMFPHGSLITVAGQLDGVRTEPLQHMQYPYPVLNIEETHIWHWEPEQYVYPYYGYYGPDWDWGWGGWGWG